MTTSAASEAPWTDYAGAILRSWRFIALGVLAVWAVMLAAALITPPDYVAVTAVSLPDLIVTAVPANRTRFEARASAAPLDLYERLNRNDAAGRTGVSIGFYKEMERIVADQAALSAGLKDQLKPAEIASILAHFEDHFTTLTTNARNEIQRIERTDGITGVVVSYTGHPAEQARAVAEALGAVVQQAFVTTLARQEIRQRLLAASRTAPEARKDVMNLAQANASLERQAQEMDRLVQQVPPVKGPQPQMMLNTLDRGYLYVPPAIQLVAVRAAIAENAHLMRTFQREAVIDELRVAFLRQVDVRLGDRATAGRSQVTGDIPAMLRSELDVFVKDKSGEEAAYVRAEMLGLCDLLASAADPARVVQSVSLQRKSRTTLLLGGMAVVVVLFAAAALVHESWRRRNGELVARAPRDAA